MIDGFGSFDYRIRVKDGGEPGKRVDMYGILLSNGYASGDQTLEAGNVQITVQPNLGSFWDSPVPSGALHFRHDSFAGGRTMPQFKVTEYHDSLGNRRGWTVVTLPNDYHEGDPVPVSHLSDLYFGTEAEANAELQRRTAEANRSSTLSTAS